jgi:60 kDa SS-A/Ro ribonucleoprotein
MKLKTKTKSLARHLSNANVPDSKPLDARQVLNSAGGWTYEVECWDQLNRFLILGTYGGTYYVSERDLTKTNVDALAKCLAIDPKRYAETVAKVSHEGRAAKNDFAVFALAYACQHSEASRKEALKQLNSVCRIGTHLFQFLEDYKALGGGLGRSMRTAISNWYTSKNIDNVAQQLIKYRNRNNWTHRDVLRISHAKSESLNNVLRYAVKGWESELEYPNAINAFEMLKKASAKEAVEIINKYDVTREFVPTNLLTDASVMNALAMKMPISAMIRNLGNMSRVLGWTPTAKSEALERTLDNLKNQEVLQKGRVHPMFVLTALKQYETSRGTSSTWDVNPKIVSGLNTAFKLSLKGVTPTKLRFLQAVDTSGSMHTPAGSNFSCSEAATAMALVVSCTEPYVRNLDFNDRVHNANVVLHDQMTVQDACRAFNGSGGTALASSVQWALDKKEVFDVIIIYTDNETWNSRTQLPIVWDEYKKKVNPKAKLVIASTAANQYTVGDPQDTSVLQTVGFDGNLLEVIKGWALG